MHGIENLIQYYFEKYITGFVLVALSYRNTKCEIELLRIDLRPYLLAAYSQKTKSSYAAGLCICFVHFAVSYNSLFPTFNFDEVEPLQDKGE